MKMLRNLFLSITVASACTSLWAAPALKSQQGLLIEQHSGLVGDEKIYITKDACKLVCEKSHFTMMMKAPDWNIVFFSDKSKMIYKTDIAHWKGDVCFAVSLVNFGRFNRLRPVSSQKENYAGAQCTVLTMRGSAPPEPFTDPTAVEFGNVVYAKYWLAEGLPVSQKAVTAICKTFRVPDQKKLPLRLFFINDNQKRKNELTTEHVTKVSFPQDVFQIPTGYKTASGEKQVLLMDPMRQSFLEDLAGE